VMPDHAHLIFTPLVSPDGWTFSLPDIMHAIKGRAAHSVNVALKRKGPVWQDEFFDHVLRSNESLSEKIDYICQNPVRAGLVREWQAYPWMWCGTVPIL
jgi:REP element-mobilizing transposase RayT